MHARKKLNEITFCKWGKTGLFLYHPLKSLRLNRTNIFIHSPFFHCYFSELHHKTPPNLKGLLRCAWKPGGSSLAPYFEGILDTSSSKSLPSNHQLGCLGLRDDEPKICQAKNPIFETTSYEVGRLSRSL